jgi:tRNA threonylcarbamoyladenosine biosynthesis protein TsaB
MILLLDTSAENVFIGIWDEVWLSKETFLGGRELNSLIIGKLGEVFAASGFNPQEVTGAIVVSGPGSFTGLRIGLSVANTLAYSLDVPIVGIKDENDYEKLLQKGLAVLKSRGASYEGAVEPQYGAEPHITKPKKG